MQIFLEILRKELTHPTMSQKTIGLIKDELGGKIIKELVGLKAKTYSYLTMTTTKVKRRKVQKVCHKKKT